MRKKKTEGAKLFWDLAEKTAKLVESWPEWKQVFAGGAQNRKQNMSDSKLVCELYKCDVCGTRFTTVPRLADDETPLQRHPNRLEGKDRCNQCATWLERSLVQVASEMATKPQYLQDAARAEFGLGPKKHGND